MVLLKVGITILYNLFLRSFYMKFKVNDSCIACGLCISMCPEVFRMSDNGIAVAYKSAEDESTIPRAVDAKISCPVQAIEEE